jgi:uncharacterized protein YbjT (DUF2867 family)
MILVTGATGTVGSEVVRRLLAAGERPRALVRDPDKARERLGEQVEHVVGDLNRMETIGAALAGVDRLFLVTTQSSRQPEWERRVIEVATRGGVGQIVKLSVFRASTRRRSGRLSSLALLSRSCGQCSLCRTCSPCCAMARFILPPPMDESPWSTLATPQPSL